MVPAMSDISPILLTGEAMHVEQRDVKGSWKAFFVHQAFSTS